MTTTARTSAWASGEDGPVVEVVDLVREFSTGTATIRAVDGITFRVEPGELVAIRGRSGSGKTTLLSLIGTLDRPTSGSVRVTGLPVSEMPERDLVAFRRRTIGFIFQAFGLLPILSAAENVEIPQRLVAAEPRAREARVAELLELVGLAGRTATGRTRCRAASSSGSPSRGRSRTGRACCSRTNRPVSLTRTPGATSWR
jgi:ABC-type lipoprotein export system ATPase subunit